MFLLNKGADPTVSRESRNSILFKSIALARKEKRGDTPPPLGLQQREQPHGLSRATDAYRMKVRRNMARQLGMDGGAANYYMSSKETTDDDLIKAFEGYTAQSTKIGIIFIAQNLAERIRDKIIDH